MITVVSRVTLKTGEELTIKLVEPPQDEYAQKLCHFLEHKRDEAFRGIQQRLAGKYTARCIDKYFVGEVAGQIAGQAWYGVPRQGTGIGNFGHVYTEPSHRRKGISTVLVGALVQDFMQQKAGKCLLCGAGETAAKIYQPFGFRLIRERSVSGPMALIKPDVAKSFAELDEWYFAPGLDAKVREGHIGDRHDCDRMLDFSKGMIELRRRWHTVFIAHQVSSFMDALFHVEDGKGITTVMQNTEGSILGYAFVLALGSPAEKDFKIMDFVLHPNYLDRAAFFVRETVRIARSAGISQAHAFVTACDKEKLAALTDGGFNEEHRFVGKFSVDGRREDIAVLVC